MHCGLNDSDMHQQNIDDIALVCTTEYDKLVTTLPGAIICNSFEIKVSRYVHADVSICGTKVPHLSRKANSSQSSRRALDLLN